MCSKYTLVKNIYEQEMNGLDKDIGEIKLCPSCKSNMVLKKGRYGLFWGCSKYPKCKCSIDASKKRSKLPPLEFIYIDYVNIIVDGEIEKILKECSEKSKKINDMLKDFKTINQCIEDNNLCYKVLEYLHKSHRYLDISKVVYAIYLVRGEVTTNYKYWINNLDYSENYIEKDVKKAIIQSWDENIFGDMKLVFVGEEIFIGDVDEGGGKLDILATECDDDIDVLIEIKGPKTNGKAAWGQLQAYLKTYQKFYGDKCKGIIVSRGYPFGIYEEIFELIGYAIEGNNITFIPWKIRLH